MAPSGWFNNSPDGMSMRRVSRMQGLAECVRTGGFKSVELNAVGWVSLVGPGVVLGLLFARLTERSFLLWGVVGGLIMWVLAASLDNVRFGQQPGRLHTDRIHADALDRLTEAARHAGITFTHEDVATDDGPMSVLYAKNRHLRRLTEILWQVQHRE